MTTLKSLAIAALLFSTACTETDERIGNTGAEISGRPYIELFRSEGSGEYYFNLIAANHEPILSSEGYASRTNALGGVLSVLSNAGNADNYQVKQAKSGDYYFNLIATNGRIIGTSEMYANASNARRGTEAVIDNCEKYDAFMSERSGARFDVFKGKDSRYYFNLHAANGEIVLSSQGYSKKASALNGTFSVADNGIDADNFDLKEASNGGFYFNLKASNGQNIGTSEIYSTKGNALRARDAIIELLPQVELL